MGSVDDALPNNSVHMAFRKTWRFSFTRRLVMARGKGFERKFTGIFFKNNTLPKKSPFDNTLMAVEESLEPANAFSGEEPELIFQHVWDVDTSRMPSYEEEKRRKLKEDEMEKEFEEIESICQEKGLNNFRTVFKKGEAAHKEIVKTAEEEDVDVIVMGSGKLHDRSVKGRIRKYVYGSVTEKVIRETPCSIMVVRPEGKLNSPEEE